MKINAKLRFIIDIPTVDVHAGDELTIAVEFNYTPKNYFDIVDGINDAVSARVGVSVDISERAGEGSYLLLNLMEIMDEVGLTDN